MYKNRIAGQNPDIPVQKRHYGVPVGKNDSIRHSKL
jgi:hypothetical protein